MAEKRTSLKKVDSEALAKGKYAATFTDGTSVECDLADVPQAMVDRFTQYGLKQKLDDAMAGVETVQEAIDELKSTWDAIKSGNWTMRVAGEGVEGGLFARAYSERHGLSLADAKAKIGSLVERNLKLNQERNVGKKDVPEFTERMIFNEIRKVALTRDKDLEAIYERLRKERESRRTTKGAPEIEL